MSPPSVVPGGLPGPGGVPAVVSAVGELVRGDQKAQTHQQVQEKSGLAGFADGGQGVV
nr:hypothetical protein [Priestia megaterium]